MYEVEADSFLKAVEQKYAYLRDAYLRGADLYGANLRDANLRDAYLYGANLRDANLRDADLRGAYLYGAKNISKFLTTTLYFLLDQPGKIRAYKLINANGEGPYNGGINYLKDKVFTAQANMNEQVQCGAGINLATLDWCMKEWREGYRILIMEFSPKRKNGAPNICVPIGSDGKFRVWECTMVGEKDLKELGLVKEKKLTSLQT
jgi:hypothetical protein